MNFMNTFFVQNLRFLAVPPNQMDFPIIEDRQIEEKFEHTSHMKEKRIKADVRRIAIENHSLFLKSDFCKQSFDASRRIDAVARRERIVLEPLV